MIYITILIRWKIHSDQFAYLILGKYARSYIWALITNASLSGHHTNQSHNVYNGPRWSLLHRYTENGTVFEVSTQMFLILFASIYFKIKALLQFTLCSSYIRQYYMMWCTLFCIKIAILICLSEFCRKTYGVRHVFSLETSFYRNISLVMVDKCQFFMFYRTLSPELTPVNKANVVENAIGNMWNSSEHNESTEINSCFETNWMASVYIWRVNFKF